MKRSERGSALMIVFVFAAMVAIMLLKEMPVVTFEAQRDKEQILMDRGKEYVRAVKLYVRKFQTFPPSVEALENTNRMRFLRHKYTDPFTGKDDWRFLHAGMGGMIVDSKIKPKKANGQSSQDGSASSTANASGLAGSGADTNSNSAAINNQPMPAPFPQRPPATGLGSGMGMQPDGQNVDPQQAAQQAAVPYPGYPGPPSAGSMPGIGASASGPMPMPSRFRGGGPPGLSSYPPGTGYPPGGVTTDLQQQGGMGNSQDPQSMMNSLLNNNNPPPTGQLGGVQTTAGTNPNPGPGMGSFNQNNAMGGTIAGVASKSSLRTIKIYNEQTDISLWEFVYDMRKEMMANAPGMNGMNGQNGMNGGIGGAGLGNSSNGNGFSGGNGFSTGSSSFGSGNQQSPGPVNQMPAPPSSQQ